MPAEGYWLSPADHDFLQEILREHRQWKHSGQRSGGSSEWQYTEGEDHQAPDVYIATPSSVEGIAGLVPQQTTHLPVDDDAVSETLCDIYAVQDGRLRWIGTKQYVVNLSLNRVRNNWFTVERDKFGTWIANEKTVLLDGLLAEPLIAATGPLTGATESYVYLIEYVSTATPTDTWRLVSKRLRVINRSVSFKGDAGTYGVFGKFGGELRTVALDCKTSDEGVHAVALVNTYGAVFGNGSFGSRSFGGGI